MKVISGEKAIQVMRLYRNTQKYFSMKHLTYQRDNNEIEGMRTVEKARLRKALRQETFQVDGDHYLPYTDLDLDEPRICWKKLIRFVAFPPNYDWLRVSWFIN